MAESVNINLKLFEKTFYKIIIDMISTLKRYNIESYNINVKIKDNQKKKLYKVLYKNTASIKSIYFKENTIGNVNECESGGDVYLDTINLTSPINNETIEFKAFDISNQYKLVRTFNQNQTIYDQKYTENKTSKINNIVIKYKKIYDYVNEIRPLIAGKFYSPCYAEPFWADDIYGDQNFNVIMKYNLFEIDYNRITSKNDIKIIKRILQ